MSSKDIQPRIGNEQHRTPDVLALRSSTVSTAVDLMRHAMLNQSGPEGLDDEDRAALGLQAQSPTETIPTSTEPAVSNVISSPTSPAIGGVATEMFGGPQEAVSDNAAYLDSIAPTQDPPITEQQAA